MRIETGNEDESPWVMDLGGWDLRESLAQELERAMGALTENLYEYLYVVENLDEAPVGWQPPSGYPYCGCSTCDTRESLITLVPLIARAVTDKRIRPTTYIEDSNVIPLLPHKGERT